MLLEQVPIIISAIKSSGILKPVKLYIYIYIKNAVRRNFMTTSLFVAGVMVVVLIALIAIMIMVSIKQFKGAGRLHGIIGVITFGFWTFIWGWMKHKGLHLTKVMIVWTILIITQMALVGIFGLGTVNELMTPATSLAGDKKNVKKISGKNSNRTKKTAQKSAYKKTAKSPKKIARKSTYKKSATSPKKTARKSVDQYKRNLRNEPQR